MNQAQVLLRNANARVVSPRGGILPAWGTNTGGVPLPNAIRYDPMGYASALPLQPNEGLVREFVFDESNGFAGMGLTDETPEVRPLPWGPDQAELKKLQKQERLDTANLMIGLVGGALGIVISVHAVRSYLKDRKKRR